MGEIKEKDRRIAVRVRDKEMWKALNVKLADTDSTFQDVGLALFQRWLVTELEQAYVCRRCKSVSYAACNHVQITGIGDSVPKTEKSSNSPHSADTLTDDEITLMESYRIASRVEHPVWVEMLASVVRQMELVARAAELEQKRKAEHQPKVPSTVGG